MCRTTRISPAQLNPFQLGCSVGVDSAKWSDLIPIKDTRAPGLLQQTRTVPDSAFVIE